MKKSRIIATGFAMFAMLFGAGNVVYPLALGRDIGHQLWFGLLGFALTAVVVPLIGLISAMLSQGDYRQVLGKLGVVPGNIVILICMILIGPFAVIPRCITIAHAAIFPYVPSVTLAIFSGVSALIIFVSTVRRTGVIDLLGKFLGPLKFTLLFAIIILGLLNPASFVQVGLSAGDAFSQGLNVGLGTADLLGTIFFSGLIFAGLRKGLQPGEELTNKQLALLGLKAGVFGGCLLGLVYTGFCIVAAYMGSQLVGVADGDVFSVIARLVLGAQGGLLANLTVSLACLTTAIALSVVFASYLHRDVLHGKTSYLFSLLVTIGATAVMSNLGFSGIMKILLPIIEIIYPALIVLALMNIVYKLFNVDFIKIPVALTFVASIVFKYFV